MADAVRFSIGKPTTSTIDNNPQKTELQKVMRENAAMGYAPPIQYNRLADGLRVVHD
jgi:hypothetical protein